MLITAYGNNEPSVKPEVGPPNPEGNDVCKTSEKNAIKTPYTEPLKIIQKKIKPITPNTTLNNQFIVFMCYLINIDNYITFTYQ